MEESGHGVVVAASTSTVGDQNNIKSQEVDNNNNAKPMLAINMDARYFSGIRRSHIIKHKEGYKQKYDKVLCDVPCSGDGTTHYTDCNEGYYDVDWNFYVHVVHLFIPHVV